MKNNFLAIILVLIFNFIIIPISISYEQFNFDVTEVEIKEDGNRFLGKKRGTATTNDGLLIKADEFDYDKIQNIRLEVKELPNNNKETLNIPYGSYISNNKIM